MMPFLSTLYPGELVITDSNQSLHTAPPIGFSTGLQPRDFAAFPAGSLPNAPVYGRKIIPRNEWDDRLAEQEKNKTRNSDLLAKAGFISSNQNGTNYCWMHGCVNAMMADRILRGYPLLKFSAASAAAPRKNYRNQGGWGGEALAWLAEHGVATVDFWPYNRIDRSLRTPEMMANAKKHLALEWEDGIPGDNFDVFATAALQNEVCPVAFNWWSHLVLGIDLVKLSSGYAMRILNSHGDSGYRVLEGRRSYPNDIQVLRTQTLSYD